MPCQCSTFAWQWFANNFRASSKALSALPGPTAVLKLRGKPRIFAKTPWGFHKKSTCPKSDIKSLNDMNVLGITLLCIWLWTNTSWLTPHNHPVPDTPDCQDIKLAMQRSQNSRLGIHFPSVAKSRDAVAFGTLSSCYIAHSYEGCCTVNNTNLSRAHSIAKRCIEHAPSKLVRFFRG